MNNCVICKLLIDKKKDAYYKVELYQKSKKLGTDFAHVSCWKEKMNMENSVLSQLNRFGDIAKKLEVRDLL